MFDIPYQLFLGFVAISIIMVIVGIVGRKAILVFVGGIFMFSMSILTDNIDMGSIPTSSVASGSTITYNYVPDFFVFDQWPKILFGMFSAIIMLTGWMVYRTNG